MLLFGILRIDAETDDWILFVGGEPLQTMSVTEAREFISANNLNDQMTSLGTFRLFSKASI